MSWRPGEEAAFHGPSGRQLRRSSTDRLATTGQRAIGFLADAAIAGTVLSTPAILLDGAVTAEDLGPGLSRLLAVVAFVFLALYEIIPTAFWGRTPGKAIVGTRVVGMADGQPPGWKRAILRWVLPALAFQVHVIGWALAVLLRAALLFDPLRRGVHDRLAGTIVVRG